MCKNGKHHILLAEPDKSHLITLQFLLENASYQVWTAQSEQEFAELLTNMPVINLIITGLTRTRHLLKQVFEGRRPAPTLLITNYKMKDGQSTAILQKPFSAEAFLQRVKEILEAQNIN